MPCSTEQNYVILQDIYSFSSLMFLVDSDFNICLQHLVFIVIICYYHYPNKLAAQLVAKAMHDHYS